jgi:hypothetical protein
MCLATFATVGGGAAMLAVGTAKGLTFYPRQAEGAYYNSSDALCPLLQLAFDALDGDCAWSRQCRTSGQRRADFTACRVQRASLGYTSLRPTAAASRSCTRRRSSPPSRARSARSRGGCSWAVGGACGCWSAARRRCCASALPPAARRRPLCCVRVLRLHATGLMRTDLVVSTARQRPAQGPARSSTAHNTAIQQQPTHTAAASEVNGSGTHAQVRVHGPAEHRRERARDGQPRLRRRRARVVPLHALQEGRERVLHLRGRLDAPVRTRMCAHACAWRHRCAQDSLSLSPRVCLTSLAGTPMVIVHLKCM